MTNSPYPYYPPQPSHPPVRKKNPAKAIALVAVALLVVTGIVVAVVAGVVIHQRQSNDLAAQAPPLSHQPSVSMMVTCPSLGDRHGIPPGPGDGDCYFVYMMTQAR